MDDYPPKHQGWDWRETDVPTLDYTELAPKGEWLWRKADQHVCRKPDLYAMYSWTGDVWRCECGNMWMISEDMGPKHERYWSAYHGKITAEGPD